METITDSQIQELRTLEQKATEAPWAHGCDDTPPDPSIDHMDGGCIAYMCEHKNIRTIMKHNEEFSHADARLIVAVRNLLPAILEEWTQLRQMYMCVYCTDKRTKETAVIDAVKEMREAEKLCEKLPCNWTTSEHSDEDLAEFNRQATRAYKAREALDAALGALG